MMQFLQSLVIAGVVGGVIYVLLRPHWVFVLVIAMFPLEQLIQSYVPVFSAYSWLFNVAIGVLSVLSVSLRLGRREPLGVGVLNPCFVCVVLIYLLFAAGLVYTSAPEIARSMASAGFPYIILFILFLPLLVLDIYEFQRMVLGFMILGTIIAIMIMLNPNSSYYSGRLSIDLGMMSTTADRRGNTLALGELGGLLALCAALARPAQATHLFTVVRIAAFIAGFGLAIGSGSRGQVLAAAIAGVALYPLARQIANPKQFFVNAIGFGLIVGGIYIVFKMFIGVQNEQRWNPLGMLRDTTMRLDMVTNLLGAYLDSPSHWLFGLGTNAFATFSGNDKIIYVHNVAAEMLCEHGIVGGLLFVMTIWLTVRYGTRLWSLHRDDPAMRATVALLLAICLYALLLSLKQGSISYPAPFFWWLVLAKLYKHEEKLLALSAPAADDAEPADHESEPAAAGDDDDGRGYALGYQ